MKKTGYILLLIVFLLLNGGAVLIQKMRQFYVQLEMTEKIKDEKTRFSRLHLSLEEYKHCKVNNHEIRRESGMYDVKSIRVNKDSVELVLISDHEEENILESIEKLGSASSRENKQLPDLALQWLSLVYIHEEISQELFFTGKKEKYFSLYCEHLYSTAGSILTPPPEYRSLTTA